MKHITSNNNKEPFPLSNTYTYMSKCMCRICKETLLKTPKSKEKCKEFHLPFFTNKIRKII